LIYLIVVTAYQVGYLTLILPLGQELPERIGVILKGRNGLPPFTQGVTGVAAWDVQL
jgi:hypothetical protein